MPEPRIRVRGITATAVSKLLLDKGYRIVQASRIIRERLGIGFDDSPADVTIKDSGPDELLVIGFHGYAEEVYGLLRDELYGVFSWSSPHGLYSAHLAIVKNARPSGECLVGLRDGYECILPSCGGLVPGRLVLISIVHPRLKPRDACRASRELRIVGEYVSLVYGSPRITVSEHVRDRDRRNYLVALAASKLFGTGLGIHFRSSSQYAGEDEIAGEIDRLRKTLEEILSRARNASEPITLYEGEYIGLLGLTSIAKERLDTLRSTVAPTIRGHHSLKSYGGPVSEVVDFAEKLLPRLGGGDIVEKALLDYCVEKMVNYPTVRIIHVKPDGVRLNLTPGVLREYRGEEGLLIMERTFKSKGVYDGLGVEKEPGDRDVMIIPLREYWISHNYYRGSEWLGSYININTPPEILPGAVKYHDLVVDVIVKTDGEADVVDRDELTELAEAGIIPRDLAMNAIGEARRIASNPTKYTATGILGEEGFPGKE